MLTQSDKRRRISATADVESMRGTKNLAMVRAEQDVFTKQRFLNREKAKRLNPAKGIGSAVFVAGPVSHLRSLSTLDDPAPISAALRLHSHLAMLSTVPLGSKGLEGPEGLDGKALVRLRPNCRNLPILMQISARPPHT